MKRIAAWGMIALLMLSLSGCGQGEATAAPPVPQLVEEKHELPAEPAPPGEPAPPEKPVLTGERSRLTGAWPEMNEADFWIALDDTAEELRMTEEQCRAYNLAQLETAGTDLVDLDAFADAADNGEVQDLLDRYGAPSATAYTDGGSLRPYVEGIEKNMALSRLNVTESLAFGFTVRPTEMRAYPSTLPVYSSPDRVEYDLAAESRAHVWTPFVVLHVSADGAWYFVRMPDYAGWVAAADAALCTREEWRSWRARLEEDFLQVTGAHVIPDQRTDLPETAGLILDMSTRLPLEEPAETDNATGDNCYIALLPVRCEDGSLDTVPVRIPTREDVSEGCLPFTGANVLRQAFKLLGRRYGWGGTFGGWDCSSLVQDVYRTVGILLPRNSAAQGRSAGAISLEGMEEAEKIGLLHGLRPGALLVMKGHQTLYLGEWEGEGFILHSTHGVYAYDGSGDFYNANSVVVTSVLSRKGDGNHTVAGFHTAVPVKLPD